MAHDFFGFFIMSLAWQTDKNLPVQQPFVVLYIFVMCKGVYVWVFYCMDVWGLCKNVGGDMVGIVMVWLYWTSL